MEEPMPYAAEHRDRMRRHIVRSARKRFHRCGFDAVSIEDIMADGGLTRGGFYSQTPPAKPVA
jgi:AcrR family transcriptional regulator